MIFKIILLFLLIIQDSFQGVDDIYNSLINYNNENDLDLEIFLNQNLAIHSRFILFQWSSFSSLDKYEYDMLWRKIGENSFQNITFDYMEDVKIYNLQPCTYYEIQLMRKGEWNEKATVKVKTEAEAPSGVTNLFSIYEKKTLHITWDPPDIVPQCVRFYKINVTYHYGTDDKPLFKYRITNITKYTFENFPTPNYTVIVHPEGEDFLKNGDYKILDKIDFKRDTDYEKPIVSYLKVTNKSFNMIEVQWEITEKSDCMFNVTWHDGSQEYNINTTDQNYTFKNLTSCTEYNITVICYTNTDQISKSITSYTLPKSKIQINNTVIEVIQSNKNFNHISTYNISWKPPGECSELDFTYNIKITNNTGFVYDNVSIKDTNYILNITYCEDKNISITPTLYKNNEIQSIETLEVINVSLPAVSNLIVKNKSCNAIEVQWDIIEIMNFIFNVTWTDGTNEHTESTPDKNIILGDLSSCTKYNIIVKTICNNNINQYSDDNSITSITFPENKKITGYESNRTSNSLFLRWEPPDECKLFNFTYIIEFNSSNFKINTTEYTFNELNPCSLYNISIKRNIIDDDNSNYNWESDEVIIQDHTTPDKNASVSNITIESNMYDINVHWLAPEGNDVCNFYYSLMIKSEEINYEDNNILKNTSFISKNLNPCVEYNVTVVVLYKNDTYGKITKAFSTKEAVPNRLSFVNCTILNEVSIINSYYITWDIPSKNKTCLKKYDYEFKENNILKWKSETLEQSLFIKDVINLCVNYTFEITPISKSGFIGKSNKCYIWNELVNGPPTYQTSNITKDFVMTYWDFTDNNYCELKELEITCNTLEDERCVKNGTLTEKFNINNSYLNFQAKLNLLPYREYNCSARLLNKIGYSDYTENITIQTEESEPYPPENVIIEDLNETFIISWLSPACRNGKLSNYSVVIIYEGPDYTTRNECDKQNINNESLTLESTEYSNYTTTVPVKNYRYGSKYSIVVQAINSLGYPSNSTIITHTTESREPEEPNIIEHKIIQPQNKNKYDGKLNLTWESPCIKNGNITMYVIEKEYDKENPININEDLNKENFDTVIELGPEINYTIRIYAKNDDMLSKPSNPITFTSPAGIPPLNIKKKTFKLTDINSDTIKIILYNDIFNHTMGTIKYYAIIIGKDNCHEFSENEYYLDWPDLRNNCSEVNIFQITETKWEPQFNHENAVEFIIGDENCIKINPNCKLEPNTKYNVKVRGFTRNGYRDTQIQYFITAEITKSVDVALLAGIIVTLVALSIIIVILYQTRGRISYLMKWPLWSTSMVSSDVSPTPQPISVKKFNSYYTKMMENSGKLKSEFQLLQTLSQDVMRPIRDATQPTNKRKNRYINILPFDDNRVKLNVQHMSDYINASYIKGFSNNIEYIAAQGPTESTCPAFWQMIYDEDIKMIIMLTQFIENGKDKCYKYFPNEMEESSIDIIEMKVQCLKEHTYEIYTQRKLILMKNDRSKEITHLSFNKWPDFGVPTKVNDMLIFCEVVSNMKKKNVGNIIVHCSAGVGRTGTLIALDILMQAIKDRQKIDIFGTVFNLRKQRMTMVQSEKQYEFLYKCIYELVSRKGKKTHNINEEMTEESNF